MKFAEKYLQSAITVIGQYDGSVPLHHFLKKQFGQNKKFGSRDRKYISHLAYAFFRLGRALKELPPHERIITSLFLSGSEEWVELYPAEWRRLASSTLEARMNEVLFTYPGFSIDAIFPFGELSGGIDKTAFALSHLRQPKLFIRTRPGKKDLVQAKLDAAGIDHDEISPDTFAINNNTKLEDVLTLNTDYVVQDLSSQRTSQLMKIAATPGMTVWDCCAASGGKAIMAHDLLPVKKLLVTDVRESILANLKLRFRQAGITSYSSKVVDLTNTAQLTAQMKGEEFDLVICDAPCSGSGTWGRTPEQLYFFEEKKIREYSDLQKQIASNATTFVKPNGFFLYITCSVFAEENEEVVKFIRDQLAMELIKAKVFTGYHEYADTMFAALFKH